MIGLCAWMSGRVLVWAILFSHGMLLAWGAYRHSPTADEPAYLAAGVSHWHFGRFDLAKVSPPLVRTWAAAPVVLTRPKTDWRHYGLAPGKRFEHQVGRAFLAANGRDSFWLFTLARWACIPFSLLGGYVCWRWASELYTPGAGLTALLLWCFGPNLLAHGQQMTPDTGVTALGVAAGYALWRWTRSGSWTWTGVAGGVLGLAVLAKTNAVALFAVIPVAWTVAAVRRRSGQGSANRCLGGKVLAMGVLAIYVVNTGYGFQGSLTPLGDYQFVSRLFTGNRETGNRESGSIGNRFQQTILAPVPVPLPDAFLEGIDLQRRDFENDDGRAKTYFQGTWHDRGWWWYYLYAAAVKEPLGTWGLFFVSLLLRTRRQTRQRPLCDDFMVLAPGLCLFGLASSQTGFGHSLRYVLPAFPFFYLLASSAVSGARLHSLRGVVCGLAVSWSVVSSLWVYPHSLAYFNELAGGPKNGHAHLLDGNLDWGQNLLFLEEWIADHPQARPIRVAYWGFLPLESLGIDFERLPSSPDRPLPDSLDQWEPGWYAVSVNFLRNEYRLQVAGLTGFRELPPTDVIGETIYVYHLPEDRIGR